MSLFDILIYNYIKNRNKINHNGWLIHADTINLRNKYENNN